MTFAYVVFFRYLCNAKNEYLLLTKEAEGCRPAARAEHGSHEIYGKRKE